MINDVLNLLKNKLNEYFGDTLGISEDKVQYIDGDKMDPITFPNNAVTPILINVEEDHIMRDPDPFTRVGNDGVKYRTYPELRLNLFVLFISRFTVYDEALKYLSLLIRYFQSNRIFSRENSPDLNPEIGRLVMELITMPFTEQDAVWNALRTTYLPSVLYKVKIIIYQDEDAVVAGAITETQDNKKQQ